MLFDVLAMVFVPPLVWFIAWNTVGRLSDYLWEKYYKEVDENGDTRE